MTVRTYKAELRKTTGGNLMHVVTDLTTGENVPDLSPFGTDWDGIFLYLADVGEDRARRRVEAVAEKYGLIVVSIEDANITTEVDDEDEDFLEGWPLCPACGMPADIKTDDGMARCSTCPDVEPIPFAS